MKKKTITEIIALLLVILFLYTGISKLMEYSVFKAQLAGSPVLAPVAQWIAWGVPFAEIAVAILLFTPRWRLKGLYASLILMVLFTGYIIAILTFSKKLPCSCGGVLELLSWKAHLALNVVFIMLALIGVLLGKRLSLIMKNITVLILLVGLSGCYGRDPEKTGLEGKRLPSFNMLLPDSITYFNTGNIPEGKPVVLYYFSPQCPYCRAQMDKIVENISLLKDIRFYVFTTRPFPEMKEFNAHYQLQQYPNIKVGVDYNSFFMEYFRVPGVPYMAIYGKDKQLNAAFMGNVYPKQIKAVAEK